MKFPIITALCLLLGACAGPDAPREAAQTSPSAAPVDAPEPARSAVDKLQAAQALPAQEKAGYVAEPRLALSPGHRQYAATADSLGPRPGTYNREGYDEIVENGFRSALSSPLSTFGLDVDTASYSNVRRFLSQGRLPPPDAVRIEELINYFDYDYAADAGGQALSLTTELAVAPWNPAHRLALIGLKARDLQPGATAANRLVFLLDTSGSMNQPAKLPLLKRSFQLLIEQMTARDSIAIVAYAGSAGMVLPPTPGSNKEAIYAALNRLQAGGSTAGAQGIELAYRLARQQHVAGANNRVILATDGDFNVGASSDGALVRLIEARRDQGIFLSVLGFGTGNYQDAKMQKLAGHGNGTHHYIDTDREAERVFREQLQGTLYTVAKDAKIQIEWNPAAVSRYRLIGYENRQLASEDFADDRKDAGDVGAGHSITVLYEIVPAAGQASGESMRYQDRRIQPRAGELGLVKWRYKPADGQKSREFRQIISSRLPEVNSANLRWASAVAELGLLLSDSEHRGQASYAAVIQRAEAVLAANDAHPLRREFIGLARQAKVAAESALGMR